MKKRMITFLAAAIITANLGAVTYLSAAKAPFTSSTSNTSKITVKSVDYDLDHNDNSIELDFSSAVRFKSGVKATVKDSSGKSYATRIDDYDSDDMELDVTGLKAGKKYTVTVTGIRKSSASKYGTLKVQFSIPKATTSLVKEAEYEHDDRELTLDFKKNVSYKNPKVTVTNTSNTKTYTTRIVEKEKDELTVRVAGLTVGTKYKYSVTGISANGSSYTKVYTGTFTARN